MSGLDVTVHATMTTGGWAVNRAEVSVFGKPAYDGSPSFTTIRVDYNPAHLLHPDPDGRMSWDDLPGLNEAIATAMKGEEG